MKDMAKLLYTFLFLINISSLVGAAEAQVNSSSAAVAAVSCPICSARFYALTPEQMNQQLDCQKKSQAIVDRSFTKKCVKVVLTAGVITAVAVLGVKHCISYIPTTFEFSARKPFG